MNKEEIAKRIEEIYATIGHVAFEGNTQRLKPKPMPSERGVDLLQDFTGDKSDIEILMEDRRMIELIAGFGDYLVTYLKRKQQPISAVTKTRDNSEEIRVLIDLWNKDKHGAHSKNTKSGKKPKLTAPSRGVQLGGMGNEIRHPDGSLTEVASFDIISAGPWTPSQFNNSKIVSITKIVDEATGEEIGTLGAFCSKALSEWERVLQEVIDAPEDMQR